MCVNEKYKRRVDYTKYMARCRTFYPNSDVQKAIAYGAYSENEANRFIEGLKRAGYLPKYRRVKLVKNGLDLAPIESIINHDFGAMELFKKIAPKKIKASANWDIGIAMDVVRHIDRLDIVVIGTADGDFTPCVQWVQEQGCLCVVYGSGIARELADQADLSLEIQEDVLV